MLETASQSQISGKKTGAQMAPVMAGCKPLDSDWRFDCRMRVVTFNLEIFKTVIKQ